MRNLKSGVRNFKVTPAAASPARFSRSATRSQRPSSARESSAASPTSCSKVISARDALGLAFGRHAPIVDAVGEAPEPSPVFAQPRDRLRWLERLQFADHAEAETSQALPRDLADAPEPVDAQRRQPGARLLAPDRREAARLVDFGGELGEKFTIAEADRDGHADLDLDAAREPGEGRGRPRPVNALAAGQVEKRLVDRDRFDERRQFEHQGANFAGDARIFGHVGGKNDGVRTELQRPRHRHRRAHPEGSRDITSGRDDAAPPVAAHDERLFGEDRIVALLHRGIKGVAVDMGERQVRRIGHRQHARRAAIRTSPRPRAGLRERGEAIATQRSRRGRALRAQASSADPPPRASRARTTSAGGQP